MAKFIEDEKERALKLVSVVHSMGQQGGSIQVTEEGTILFYVGERLILIVVPKTVIMAEQSDVGGLEELAKTVG